MGGPKEDIPDEATALAVPEQASAAEQPEGATSAGGGAAWGRYDGVAAVDSLLEYLHPLGQREAALKRVRALPELSTTKFLPQNFTFTSTTIFLLLTF